MVGGSESAGRTASVAAAVRARHAGDVECRHHVTARHRLFVDRVPVTVEGCVHYYLVAEERKGGRGKGAVYLCGAR